MAICQSEDWLTSMKALSSMILIAATVFPLRAENTDKMAPDCAGMKIGRVTVYVSVREPVGKNRALLLKKLAGEGFSVFEEGEDEVSLTLSLEELEKLFQARVTFTPTGASAGDDLICDPTLEEVTIPKRFKSLIDHVYFDPQRS